MPKLRFLSYARDSIILFYNVFVKYIGEKIQQTKNITVFLRCLSLLFWSRI